MRSTTMLGNGYKRLTLALFGLSFLVGCSGCSTTQTASSSKTETRVSSSAPSATSEEAALAPYPVCSVPTAAPYYPPPEKIDLCGDPVPLNLEDVQERFDKEFTLIVYNHAQVYLWLKRMERYFPWIEERLKFYQLPDDLKYVAIVESDLQPNACSPKGAAGPWQFMPSTGASYGLDQQGAYDGRYDFERATESAFRLLSDLYKRYKNWPVAIAAYNCGDKRIIDEMKSQRVSDYYHLKLPTETERYVFRILAVKAVLSSPSQYGYNLPKGQGYSELKMDTINLTLNSPTSIQTLATAAGTTYREMKRLNPTIRADEIPPGTYEIKLPVGTRSAFERNFVSARADLQSRAEDMNPVVKGAPPQLEARVSEPRKEPVKAVSRPVEQKVEPIKPANPNTNSPSVASMSHTVKKGETLSGIAQKYKVNVDAIRKLNSIKGNGIEPGQKLSIPKP